MPRVLITGAGSGIGRACAERLASEGWQVVASGRREGPLHDLVATAANVIPLVMDVTDDASVRAGIEAAGPLDAVVNNAGVSVMGAVEAVPMEAWRRQFETNLFGVARVCQAALPTLRERRGRIVNIGSVAGRIASPFMGVYASSKHALEGMTDALRREVAAHGVPVVLVRPGFVNTPFGAQEQASLAAHAHPAYAAAQARFARWHREEGHAASPGPEVVAEVVARALTDARPRDRYAAPARARRLLAMRNALPTRLVDAMVARTIEGRAEMPGLFGSTRRASERHPGPD